MTYKQYLRVFPVVLFLAVVSNPPQAMAASSGTFVETFQNKFLRDLRTTTATWSSDDKTITLPLKVQYSRIDQGQGIPANTITAVGTNGTESLVAGVQYSYEGPGIQTHVTFGRWKDNVYTDLSSVFQGYLDPPENIIWTGSTWVVSGPGLLASFDGTLHRMDSALGDIGGSHDAHWNGTTWLVVGTGILGVFDGATFQNKWSEFGLPNSPASAAWDGSQWIVAVSQDKIYSFDGTSLTPIGQPSDLFLTWSVASNTKTTLVTGTDVAGHAAIYKIDGSNFRKVFALKVPSIAMSVVWTGKRWVATISQAETGAIYTSTAALKKWKPLGLPLKTGDSFNLFSDAATQTHEWTASGTNIVYIPGAPIYRGFLISAKETYAATAMVQSTTFTKSMRKVRTALLRPTTEIPSGTKITFQVSADDGGHWQSVQAGVETSLLYRGRNLRWWAKLSTTNSDHTPVLRLVRISYKTI